MLCWDRASMPVVVAAVAVFVERKVPTRTELVALLLLTAGVIVSVFEGKASGNTFGIAISITGAQAEIRWPEHITGEFSSLQQGQALSLSHG